MVNRYDDDGCWTDGTGALVLYTAYRELEVRHDVFLKEVRRIMDDLSGVNELSEGFTKDEAFDADCAITEAIRILRRLSWRKPIHGR